MPTSLRLRLLSLLVLAMPGVVAAQPAADLEDPATDEPIGYAEDEVVEEPAEEAEAEATDADAADADEASTTAASGDATAGAPRRRRWLAPEPTFTIHGYLRTRGEWQDNFFIGRTADTATSTLLAYPFRYFMPLDRGSSVFGDCGSSAPASGGSATAGCFRKSDQIRYANMRMRLAPSVSLSDDVRVHMVLDVFDNMVLGSTPDASSYNAYALPGMTAPGVPLDFFTSTLNPAVAGRNSMTNSIYVRRAWAEVGNRDLGELRFGRMAVHWGLGMLWNAGAGIDSDYSTDVDRVMVSRQLFGFTVGAAWDFMDEGAVVYPGNLRGLAYDATNRDDVRQFSFFAARTLTPEEEQDRLGRGKAVLVGGLYYQYRNQDFGWSPGLTSTSMAPTGAIYDPNTTTSGLSASFIRRDATSHSLDGWARFRWKDLRVELEAALIAGNIMNTSYSEYQRDNLKLLQFGFALESEYRVLDGSLGIYFNTGLATGDRDVNGMSIREDTVTQVSDRTGGSSDGRATHFTFHPNYRIDLILFRNILGSVGGAYYFRPGVSYDLVHTDAGRLLGVRADVVYSRATQQMQTYGGDPSLGLELDGSIYYRSEDGPDLTDGFWAAFHYGLLFPLAGLGYRAGEVTSTPSISKAQTMRVVLGVNF